MGLGKILDDNVLAMALPSGPPPSLRKDGKKPHKVMPVEDGTGSGSSILNSIGTPVESRSFQGGSQMSSGRNRHERVIRRICLRAFLRINGFREGDAHSARPGGCFFRRESVCPIHVAAMKGDYDVLVMLLEEGADPEKETSRGRTPMDCALAGDVCGSNQKTVKLLQRALRK
mmetsp:Transcript_32233/g.69662  ORF Transcript_32233/g.69662 Transcript_32233/m.69662 type:complete len:173 (+) Transcript_32233:69-587(+)